jgi:hypothetical protein
MLVTKSHLNLQRNSQIVIMKIFLGMVNIFFYFFLILTESSVNLASFTTVPEHNDTNKYSFEIHRSFQ